MSKATPYADLGKDGNDLVILGFPASGAKSTTWNQACSIAVNHEAAPNGFVLKSSVLQGPKGVNLTFKPEYKWAVGNNLFQFKGKADTATDLTEGSLAVSDLAIVGTEITPWIKRGVEDKVLRTAGGVTVGYANERVNFSVKTETPLDFSQHKADLNFVLQYPDNLFWGVNYQYTTPKGDTPRVVDGKEVKPVAVSDVNLKIHYARKDSAFTAGLETNPKEKQKELTFTWLQTVSEALKVVTRFVVPTVGTPTALVGTQHKWDSSTTVKSKLSVSKEARLVLSYQQVVSPYATATIGADLNANKLVGYGEGADHHFGLEVKLK
jgi:hypothetical protein